VEAQLSALWANSTRVGVNSAGAHQGACQHFVISARGDEGLPFPPFPTTSISLTAFFLSSVKPCGLPPLWGTGVIARNQNRNHDRRDTGREEERGTRGWGKGRRMVRRIVVEAARSEKAGRERN
jgi:hypothetical protein